METVKILIVEDEPNMVAGLRDNFEYEGFQVMTALDGVEGLEKAPDAINMLFTGGNTGKLIVKV